MGRDNDVDVKITDFGLAKRANKEGLKTFCGTPQYFAPEVLKRRNTVLGVGRYGKEADMWSVGEWAPWRRSVVFAIFSNVAADLGLSPAQADPMHVPDGLPGLTRYGTVSCRKTVLRFLPGALDLAYCRREVGHG